MSSNNLLFGPSVYFGSFLLICAVLYFREVVYPQIRLKKNFLAGIMRNDYGSAAFLLFYALSKWPKSILFRNLKTQYAGKMQAAETHEKSRIDFKSLFKLCGVKCMSDIEQEKIGNELKLQLQEKIKLKGKFIYADLTAIIISIIVNFISTTTDPTHFGWIYVFPVLYILAVIVMIAAVYLQITPNRQSCENNRLYRASFGVYLALWSFCYAVSCASQSESIRLLAYIWIGCSTVLNAWLYWRRITVLKRKKILPSVFPLIDALVTFSGIFPLLPIMFLSNLSTYTILITIYFLVVGSGFSLQTFNFAEFLYFKKYRKFAEAMKFAQLYKDSKNDLCV